jgi:tetratricopeptide (TPR) repeat protein
MLYLTARGLVGTREAAKVETAIDILRQATDRDPNFAPSWALLAKALIHQSRPRPDAMAKFPITAEARNAVKRALQLDSRSADAHLALGMALGPGKGRRTAFERAVRLDPGNSENWAALAFDYRFGGDYEREYAAWRRAATIDPLWARAFFSASEAAWDLGLRKEAEVFSSRAAQENAFNAAMTRSDFGMRRGQFAAAFRDGRVAQAAATRGRSQWALVAQGRALRAMNLYEPARNVWLFYKVDDVMWRMWHNRAPTPAELARESASSDRIWADDARVTFLFATLLNAGRMQEAADLFDSLFKTPAAMADPSPLGHAIFVRQAALVYLALSQTGRARQAAELRGIADAAVGRTLGQARVPNWYHALAAQWQAASGRTEAALASLERADRGGWFYSRERDSFGDMALEPAFGPLRGKARFERVRAHQRGIVAQEAAKLRFDAS